METNRGILWTETFSTKQQLNRAFLEAVEKSDEDRVCAMLPHVSNNREVLSSALKRAVGNVRIVEHIRLSLAPQCKSTDVFCPVKGVKFVKEV